MKTQQFAVRRRFAKTAFAVLIFTLFFCLWIAYAGDAQAASNLREAGIIVAPIIVCFAALIAQYAHLVSQADNQNANKT